MAPAVGPLVRGESESLRMLLDNLVENAALHGRPGGTVVLTAAPLAGGGAEVLALDAVPADEDQVWSIWAGNARVVR